MAKRRRAAAHVPWKFNPFWHLVVPTAAFFLLRRWSVTAPWVNKVVPEESIAAWLPNWLLVEESEAEKVGKSTYYAYKDLKTTPPPVQIQIGPGSIGGAKRWLPPGSTITIYPCPAGYARAKMDPGAEPWPPSPGPGWIQDSTVGLGNCRKA